MPWDGIHSSSGSALDDVALTSYHTRWEEQRVARLVEQMPVTVVTGARQVGKTTLLRRLEQTLQQTRACRYLTLDDLSVAAQARDDPRSLWQGYDLVMIDEVQRDPALLLAVKAAVDEARWETLAEGERGAGGAAPSGRGAGAGPGAGHGPRFILSGSANLLLMRSVAESLAGRAAYVVLRPFTIGELLGSPTPPGILRLLFDSGLPAPGLRGVGGAMPSLPAVDAYAVISRGLMPGLYGGSGEVSPSVWWNGYVTTYLERDLRALADVSSLIDFRRVMQALAVRTGRLLNQAEVARDTATPTSTLGRWLGLLEAGLLAERVPAYSSNLGQRLVKMTRLFWTDPGLPAFLAGLTGAEAVEQSREAGMLFENVVFHHLSVLAGLLDPPGRLYPWRPPRGDEVDFVVERGRSSVAFEVKSATRVAYGDASGLRAFIAANGGCRAGVLVYRGAEVVHLGSRVVALPWEMLGLEDAAT